MCYPCCATPDMLSLLSLISAVVLLLCSPCYSCCATPVVLPLLCYPCCATPAVLHLLCYPRCSCCAPLAAPAVQPLPCHLCCAALAVLPLLSCSCHGHPVLLFLNCPCCAAPVVLPLPSCAGLPFHGLTLRYPSATAVVVQQAKLHAAWGYQKLLLLRASCNSINFK